MSNKDTRVGNMTLVASRPVTSKRMHAVSAPESLEGLGRVSHYEIDDPCERGVIYVLLPEPLGVPDERRAVLGLKSSHGIGPCMPHREGRGRTRTTVPCRL